MNQNKKFLFTYGSLLLNNHGLNIEFKPLKSVFIKGYSLYIEKSPITKSNYHYISLIESVNDNAIPGFLVELSDDEFEMLDMYEGKSYERKVRICLDRRLKEISCYVYIKK